MRDVVERRNTSDWSVHQLQLRHYDLEKRWSEMVPKLGTQVSGGVLALSILTAKEETGKCFYYAQYDTSFLGFNISNLDACTQKIKKKISRFANVGG